MRSSSPLRARRCRHAAIEMPATRQSFAATSSGHARSHPASSPADATPGSRRVGASGLDASQPPVGCATLASPTGATEQTHAPAALRELTQGSTSRQAFLQPNPTRLQGHRLAPTALAPTPLGPTPHVLLLRSVHCRSALGTQRAEVAARAGAAQAAAVVAVAVAAVVVAAVVVAAGGCALAPAWAKAWSTCAAYAVGSVTRQCSR